MKDDFKLHRVGDTKNPLSDAEQRELRKRMGADENTGLYSTTGGNTYENIENLGANLGLVDKGSPSYNVDYKSMAKQVGMNNFDVENMADYEELEKRLRTIQDQKLSEEQVSDNPEDIIDPKKENPYGLKEGFGRKEYEKKLKNKNYYDQEAEKIKQRIGDAKNEKARNWKMKDKNADPNKVKGDGSDTKNKNALDKAKDAKELAKANIDLAKNKVSEAKAKAYETLHPVEAAKAKAKIELKKKAVLFIKAHALGIGIAVAVIALILFLLLILIGLSGSDEEQWESQTEVNAEYDFTLTSVRVKNGLIDEPFYTVDINDFAMGAAYAEITNSIKDLTDEQKKEVYKAYLTYAKAQALGMGKYDSNTKEIIINSDTTGIPYCSVYTGCTIYTKDGNYYYAPYNYTDDQLPGTFYTRIEPMDSSEVSLLTSAASATKYLLLVPDSIQSMITTADYGLIPYNPDIKERWISAIKGGKDFKDAIAETSEYSSYQIYDHEQMATQYAYASHDTYWWPIGSASKDSNNLYSGTPTATYVSSPYGWRTDPYTGFHDGIDIAAGTCDKNVLIAAKDGTVVVARGGCTTGYLGNTCNGGAGNYVKIDHGDGVTTLYAHMAPNSIEVKVGQKVAQGQSIGRMGTTGNSTGCHLHFSMSVNGQSVNPADYVNAKNPRPVGINLSNGYAEGDSVQQSVCLTLKKIGFSNNAVAALMTNISHESGFRLTALGDSGTSYGLCQWHNSRNAALKTYCGSNLNTTKCQIDYLMKELQEGYKGVFNYLQTNNSAYDMTYYFCYNFERPANKGVTCSNRGNNSSGFLNYVNNGCR